jgi:hypothetical protein
MLGEKESLLKQIALLCAVIVGPEYKTFRIPSGGSFQQSNLVTVNVEIGF